MSTTREKLVAQAVSWLGCKESDGSHKKIIDVYNSHKPLARGHRMAYTDDWCAAFVTACAIKCGATDIIPKECSCSKMIELFKGLGCWVENDAYVPAPGDIIFYDWSDSGIGDNKGGSDHVGIVEKVSGTTITIIDGNNSNGQCVRRRTVKVNGRYIRGYGVPKYQVSTAGSTVSTTATTGTKGNCTVTLPILCKGSKGSGVVLLQNLLNIHGCTDSKGQPLATDGSFGPATQYALATFQSYHYLKADCICGHATWAELMKINE